MTVIRSLLAAVAVSSAVFQASAIAIVDNDICVIPYMVPRAFQRDSDPVDEFVTEAMLPTKVESGYKGRHPQWLSSMAIRSRPNVWTIEPYCLRSLDFAGDICVFTSTIFGNGRGVSIVAAPAEAPYVIQAKSLAEQTTFKFPDHANLRVDPRIQKTAIPNKGFGMISKKHFLRGDPMQSFTPTISIQDSVMQMPLNTWEQNTPLNVAVRRLPEFTANQFMDLHGQFGGHPVYDKVNTNAFNALLGKSTVFFWSIYPETARFNHDCRPNTMYSIEDTDLLHNLRVGRTIIPGEEITLSYLAPNMRHAERNQRMESQWGFKCSCTQCKSLPDVIEMSDYRITLIEELEAELNDLTPSRNATLSTAELLITLHEQERLDGVIGDAYMYAAFESAYLGDRRQTQKYAALALQHMAIWRGIAHQYYGAMQRLLVNPEKEKSWLYFEKLARGEVKPL